jgi:hypothetical protein
MLAGRTRNETRPRAHLIIEGSTLADDPIHQFQISKLIPIEIGGLDLSFTNSSLFMVATVATAGAFPLSHDVEPRPDPEPHAVRF